MSNPRIFILADDLTGALEVGAKFAASGVMSEVSTAPTVLPQGFDVAAGVIVIDTETRHSTPAEAVEVVSALARAARKAEYSRVYKKTDSTLRGNIGAEFAALTDAFGGAPLLYVPAYPQMGRTVKGGSLFVNGVPVSATSFAQDPFNPIRESHIPTLLRSQCALPIQSGPVSGFAKSDFSGIAVCDGESDQDVESAARFFLQSAKIRMAAGPAGFAAHLARHSDLPRQRPGALPYIKTALVVNGSLHPASQQQIMRALEEGFGSIEAESSGAAHIGENWAILAPSAGAGAASLDFANELAQSVCHLLTLNSIDALVIFGGDTAFQIVKALGSPPMHMVGEVSEGIPVAKIHSGQIGKHLGNCERELYLITKAGGFGAPSVLNDIRNSLGKE